ncbi:MAG TPA: hypothetical protein VNV60_12120, partial [Holophagaceae bacterium]|nr:hypothetical protein [Holophagaceae bacterium]
TVEQWLSGKPFNIDERIKEMENPAPLTPEQDQARWESTAKALRGFMGVEGWQIHQRLFLVLSRLDAAIAKASLILKDPFQRMEQGVEAALREHPSDEGLWGLGFSFENLASIIDPEALLASLEPPPHAPWPPEPACGPLVMAFARRDDWAGLEDLAARAFARGMNPAVALYQGQDFRVRMIRSWGSVRFVALVHLGRKDEAAGFVKELRAQAGSAWQDIASDDLARPLEYNLGKDDPLVQSLRAAKDDKAPPDPPKLAFPPVPHLALLGHPAWERAWKGLAANSAFDAWEPGEELGWQPLKPKEEQALRVDLGPEPRWVLLRGEELLASGTELPRPAFLADRLRAEGLPYLEQLDAFIRTHPDHLEAREARMEALRGRMPNERLEATLLGDARATLAPFLQGAEVRLPADWKPRKELWAPAARRVLPELEAHLRRWPERKGLWEAWLDWAQVSADPPSPARMMESLAIWKTRTGGGAGPLPDAVLEAVSKHLVEEERWKDLADWCRAFWEGGVRDELARLALPLPGGRRQDRDRRGEQTQFYSRAVLNPYRTALEKLGRIAQLRVFLDDVKSADPSLARTLTASSTPPHPG